MKNRIHVVNTTFKVDETNRVVVCVLECDMRMDKHLSWSYISFDMWKKKFPNVNWNGTFTVKAKARCNPDDAFDAEKGKRLAESRAKAKMFYVAERVWTTVSDFFNNMAVECMKAADACSLAKEIEDKHTKELMKG